MTDKMNKDKMNKEKEVLRELFINMGWGKNKEFIKLMNQNLHLLNGKYKNGESFLFSAIGARKEYSNMEIIRYLVEVGADVNDHDRCGFTPLFAACLYGQLDIVKYLVESGADINKKTDKGSSPILFAAKSQDAYKIVRYLVENGADYKTKPKKLNSLLTIVTLNLDVETTKYLINEKDCPVHEDTEFQLYLLRFLLRERNEEAFNAITKLIKSRRGNSDWSKFIGFETLRGDDVISI